MHQRLPTIAVSAVVLIAAVRGGAQEQGPPEAAAPEASAPASTPGILAELEDAFIKGSVHLDLRLRAEIVEQSDLDTAQAYTERIRLGYGTRPFHGLSFLVEFEDTRSADEDLYNAAGLNDQPDKAVVADPENTELNQFLARYERALVKDVHFTAVAGRQRITLDDQRFIGNVGWRQNEQTFDAYTATATWAPEERGEWVPETSLLYSYVDDVNRIFGPDAHRDFDSDSHFLNAAFRGLPIGTLTGFAYFLDFQNSAVNSSNTVGLRLAGKRAVPGELEAGYAASYAYQVDAGNNPDNYDAHYYLFEGSVGKKSLGACGAGYEVLDSDGGDAAFQTPLATLHAMNGWADQFLVTPADGLEDLYFFLDAELPFEVKGRAVYHLYFSEARSRDYGGEFDALLARALTKNVNVLGKLAVFHGESGLPSNVQKYWVQTEVKF